MRKQKTSIEIPKPCTESWAGMTPDTNGRFCGSCQKTVIDFTQLSDKAILDYFKNNTGNSCGRFYNAQLNRELIEPKEPKKFSIYKWMLSLFLFINTNKVNAQSEVTPVICDTVVKPVKSKVNSAADKYYTSRNRFTGKIIDTLKNPIVGVIIQLKENNSIAITNEFGEFDLFIQSRLIKDTMVFYLSSVEIGNQNLCFSSDVLYKQNNIITLNKTDLQNNPEVVVTIGYAVRKKKKHWWWPFGKRR